MSNYTSHKTRISRGVKTVERIWETRTTLQTRETYMIRNMYYFSVLVMLSCISGDVIGAYNICIVPLVNLHVDSEFSSKGLDLQIVTKNSRLFHSLQPQLKRFVDFILGVRF
jgi:hypothetical protein